MCLSERGRRKREEEEMLSSHWHTRLNRYESFPPSLSGLTSPNEGGGGGGGGDGGTYPLHRNNNTNNNNHNDKDEDKANDTNVLVDKMQASTCSQQNNSLVPNGTYLPPRWGYAGRCRGGRYGDNVNIRNKATIQTTYPLSSSSLPSPRQIARRQNLTHTPRPKPAHRLASEHGGQKTTMRNEMEKEKEKQNQQKEGRQDKAQYAVVAGELMIVEKEEDVMGGQNGNDSGNDNLRRGRGYRVVRRASIPLKNRREKSADVYGEKRDAELDEEKEEEEEEEEKSKDEKPPPFVVQVYTLVPFAHSLTHLWHQSSPSPSLCKREEVCLFFVRFSSGQIQVADEKWPPM